MSGIWEGRTSDATVSVHEQLCNPILTLWGYTELCSADGNSWSRQLVARVKASIPSYHSIVPSVSNCLLRPGT